MLCVLAASMTSGIDDASMEISLARKKWYTNAPQ
jgi:hypothetical protein